MSPASRPWPAALAFCAGLLVAGGDACSRDLQLFKSGASVQIRPTRVQSLFDGRPGSPALSDHDGFRVTYELSWSVAPNDPPVGERPKFAAARPQAHCAYPQPRRAP